jgi:hypothetical protein
MEEMSNALEVSHLTVSMFGGCVSGTGTWVFEKSGTTEAQLKRDRDECFAQSIDAENHGGFGFQISRDAYRDCMEQRGYRVRVTLAAEIPALER